jgi:hypothetical protein
MKLVKGLFLTLVLSCIFAAAGVNAVIWYTAYNDVSIPALQVAWSDGDYWKQSDTDHYQYLETIESADPIFFDTRVVQARTKHMVEPTSSSSWKDAPKDSKINWGNQNSAQGVYRLEIKNKSFTLNSTRYWGIWSWD